MLKRPLPPGEETEDPLGKPWKRQSPDYPESLRTQACSPSSLGAVSQARAPCLQIANSRSDTAEQRGVPAVRKTLESRTLSGRFGHDHVSCCKLREGRHRAQDRVYTQQQLQMFGKASMYLLVQRIGLVVVSEFVAGARHLSIHSRPIRQVGASGKTNLNCLFGELRLDALQKAATRDWKYPQCKLQQP